MTVKTSQARKPGSRRECGVMGRSYVMLAIVIVGLSVVLDVIIRVARSLVYEWVFNSVYIWPNLCVCFRSIGTKT